MSSVLAPAASSLDFDRLRGAGADVLSLALIDARNRSLRWVAALEVAAGAGGGDDEPADAEVAEPLAWTLGHIAWFQERWIGRNVQRARGERADPAAPRLPPLHAAVDDSFDGELSPLRRRELAGAFGDLQAVRDYAVETLEQSLELLDGAGVAGDGAGSDDALYFFRLALFHEAMHEEGFAVRAQAAGVDARLIGRAAAAAPRPPLLFPATRWRLGVDSPGFAFDNQRQPHVVQVPEFEIDAQAVTWAQYVEFVEDGGYDEPAHWSDAGRGWLARQGRRTPRYVEQMRHGVLLRRFGRSTRAPMQQAAMHVTAHEAEAWCRWAGRRLPSEVEWEAAAHQGANRGFRFGEVREWTATTFRPWPGFVAGPWRDLSLPAFGTTRVLRGASLATPLSLVGARIRDFAEADRDDGFYGFRSCAS